MQNYEDRLTSEEGESGISLQLKGSWTLLDGLVPADAFLARTSATSSPRKISVDASRVESWDSALVCFLADLQRTAESLNIEVTVSNLPSGVDRLLSLASAVPVRAPSRNAREKETGLARLGNQVLDALKNSGEMVEFLGETAIALGQTLKRKSQFRMVDVWLVFDQCGPGALPIVGLISFLVGMILSFVGLVQLKQFGADIYVANLVAVAMVREMGGMMTGIIMAGRTGAAFAAQLGTMQVNDEISAFKTFGIQPIAFLVLPRMLALIVAVPLLTLYANVVGMLGGSVVAGALSDVSFLQYYSQTITSVNVADWVSGLFKASVYGVIIAAAGCMRGIQCGKNAEAVGQAATSAVVLAITMIIVAEAILTIIYQVLGI